mgnify:CR=1 FL=1
MPTPRRRNRSVSAPTLKVAPPPVDVLVIEGELPLPDPLPSWCGGCGRGGYWLSIYQRVICEFCHPPAAESLVARRFTVPDRLKALRTILPPAARDTSYYGRLDARAIRDEAVETEGEEPPPWMPT